MQDFRLVTLPHGDKGRARRDGSHIDFPRVKVIIGQLAILVAIPGDFEQAQLYKAVVVAPDFLSSTPSRSQSGIVYDHLPDL